MKHFVKFILLMNFVVFCACGNKNDNNNQFMKNYQQKSVKDLKVSVPDLIGNAWMLTTAGTLESYNTMTASWGQIGHLWNKDVATMYIRPQRYTKEFVEREAVFTLSFFREEYRAALNICGTKSGRDGDKVKEAGLTPIPTPAGSVAFAEAYMIIECRKLYAQDLVPEAFVDTALCTKIYPKEDYHTQYIGEILGVYVK